MDQTGSGSTTLVQEKIKRMLESKRKLNKKDDPQANKELKSQLDDNGNVPQKHQQRRLKSAMKRRSNSVRNVESSTSIPTENKQQVDAQSLISHAFEFGAKLKEFIKAQDIDAQQTKQMLSKNQYFILLLNCKLTAINQEKHGQRTEKEIIKKLQKMKAIAQQQKNCLIAQNRINSLIEGRLKQLRKY